MFPSEIQEDSALRELHERLVDAGREPEVDEGVPREPIAEDGPPEQDPRHGDLPEVSEEVVERDGPRVQV